MFSSLHWALPYNLSSQNSEGVDATSYAQLIVLDLIILTVFGQGGLHTQFFPAYYYLICLRSKYSPSTLF
jgi:hypothetical protein